MGPAAVPHPSLSSRLTQRFEGEPVRVLIVPGLHNSGPGHWQTWLQGQYQGAQRVHQARWHEPDLDVWAAQIAQVIENASPRVTWIAVAHSFGCLALARYLQQHRSSHGSQAPIRQGVQAALIVAPADPKKFQVQDRLPQSGLGISTTLVGSENDPWMPLEDASWWAKRWGSRFLNLGPAGHINHESGHGPWPWARYHVDHLIRDQQRQRRLERIHPMELSYAI